MPAVTAHYYFGQEVLRRLPEEIARIILDHKSAFDLGLQGPDLLFYHTPIKRNDVVKLGIQMHNEDASIPVTNAIETIQKEPNDMALSYLLGFVCHFVLDSSLHTEISRLAPSHGEHFALEAEMDRQVIQLHYYNKPHHFRRDKLVKINAKEFGWLKPVYPTLSEKDLKKSVHGFTFYLRLLRSKGNTKRKALMFIEKAAHQQGAFTTMIVSSQKNMKYFDDVKRLCGKMKEIFPVAVQAVGNVYECVKGDAVLLSLFNKDFE